MYNDTKANQPIVGAIVQEKELAREGSLNKERGDAVEVMLNCVSKVVGIK